MTYTILLCIIIITAYAHNIITAIHIANIQRKLNWLMLMLNTSHEKLNVPVSSENKEIKTSAISVEDL